MKTLTCIVGYIVCGHVAVKADGVTMVQCSDKRSKDIGRIIERRATVHPEDRIVDAQEFSDITGLKLVTSERTVKPRRLIYKSKSKNILDLIS